MHVLIDAGHGIETPGKRSPDGRFREYLWNRQVADIVREELGLLGVSAGLVVPETNDIALSTRAARVNRIARQIGRENTLLVSIHANAAGDGTSWHSAKGWSCYTSPGRTDSDRLADYLYDVFAEEFTDRKIRTDYSDGDRDWEANFTMLTKTICPAVLTENFFYDNREECGWLLREDTQERIGWTICRGILKYIRNR